MQGWFILLHAQLIQTNLNAVIQLLVKFHFYQKIAMSMVSRLDDKCHAGLGLRCGGS